MGRTGLKHTNTSALCDNDLIALASAGNQTAFMKLYERYKDGLKGHISKILSTTPEIEDAVMESLLKAFMQIGTFDSSKATFKTWLYKIGWNTALDHAVRRKREMDNMPTTPIDAEAADGLKLSRIADPGKDPEEDFSTKEEYDKLMVYIEELKDKYREVARLRLINDMDYAEIAEALDLPLNTVKTRIRRAKDELQKMMETSDEIMLPSNDIQ